MPDSGAPNAGGWMCSTGWAGPSVSPPLDMTANVADLPRSIRPARLPAGGGRHPRISSAFAEAKVIHVFRPNLPVRQLPFVRQRRERLPAPAGTNDWVATAGGTPTFRRDAPFPGRRFPPPLPRGHACAEPAPAEAGGMTRVGGRPVARRDTPFPGMAPASTVASCNAAQRARVPVNDLRVYSLQACSRVAVG